MSTAATPTPASPPGGPQGAPHARLSQLDGLRGFAAVVIMLYHADMVFRTHTPFVRGYLLVDLFFLLSGFVLAVSTEKKLNAGIGAIAFTRARFVRLWPLVAVGAGVAAVRSLVLGAHPLELALTLALDLAMIPSLAGRGPFYRLNGPQWTLFYELLANFLHALLLRRVPTRWLPLIAALFGAALVYTVRRHGADTMGVNAPTWKTWWMALPRVGWSYVLGVWLGRLYKAGVRTPALPWPIALALPMAGIMLVPGLPFRMATGDLLFVIPFLPVAMWGVAMCRPPQALMPALEWLGTFSLPLYCVHLTVLVSMSELFGRGIGVKYGAIAAALVLSYLFFRLVSFQAKPTEVKTKAA
ncbi:acyltransferase family protein [Novosphingobium aerophilum]|uniref:Acyltransferase n=1 Tax=Novosphingobium aerophilum TaxID=2839843 RepID=A0A7X1F7A3_9SPHN|nr:acyltransferase [Novosphingobium aerophilum]MBC2651677.1 acyltransferase [Novosphingobium aerophilum]